MSESREFSANIIEGWRITIPEEIRFDLRISKGDRVKVVIKKALILKGDTLI